MREYKSRIRCLQCIIGTCRPDIGSHACLLETGNPIISFLNLFTHEVMIYVQDTKERSIKLHPVLPSKFIWAFYGGNNWTNVVDGKCQAGFCATMTSTKVLDGERKLVSTVEWRNHRITKPSRWTLATQICAANAAVDRMLCCASMVAEVVFGTGPCDKSPPAICFYLVTGSTSSYDCTTSVNCSLQSKRALIEFCSKGFVDKHGARWAPTWHMRCDGFTKMDRKLRTELLAFMDQARIVFIDNVNRALVH